MNDLKEILSRYDISIEDTNTYQDYKVIEYLLIPKHPFIYNNKTIPIEIHWRCVDFLVGKNSGSISLHINNNTFYYIKSIVIRESNNETDKYLPMSFEEQIFETVIDLYQVLKKYNFNIPKELL